MPGVYEFQRPGRSPARTYPLQRFEGPGVVDRQHSERLRIFTPQYQGLETLQRQLAPRGFSVLGFPCNQFGGQEPGNAKTIAEIFCESNYHVSLSDVRQDRRQYGGNAHPLYRYLKGEKSGLLGSAIKWNFTKFLVDRAGKVVARHAPTARPEGLRQDIEALL